MFAHKTAARFALTLLVGSSLVGCTLSEYSRPNQPATARQQASQGDVASARAQCVGGRRTGPNESASKRYPGDAWTIDDIPVDFNTGKPTAEWPRQKQAIDSVTYGPGLPGDVAHCGAHPRGGDVTLAGIVGDPISGLIDRNGTLVTNHRTVHSPLDIRGAITWWGADGAQRQLDFSDIKGMSNLVEDPSTGDLIVGITHWVDKDTSKGTMRLTRISSDGKILDEDLFDEIRKAKPSGFRYVSLASFAVSQKGEIYVGLTLVRRRRAHEKGGRLDVGEMMLAKIDADGDLQWTERIKTKFFNQQSYHAGNSTISAMAVSPNGDVIVTASTANHIGRHRNKGHLDVVALRYSPDGKKKWMRAWGSHGSEYPAKVAVDESGHIAIVGNTRGPLHGKHAKIFRPNEDSFVTLLDRGGQELWSHQFGTKYNEFVSSVDFTEQGSLLVTGFTKGDFREPDAFDINRSFGHPEDMFIARFDAGGRFGWVDQFGRYQKAEKANEAVVRPDGTLHILGSAYGKLSRGGSVHDWNMVVTTSKP
ncbi:hypothetical protein FIV42_22530 [Persicimonas caeni]|uniref:WD40 repeat domain-containing protein n=1 Tax=Persicimonas caeni TaxID=2292766 RepID=A0A4Y6PZI4_PERCE|nr:hypothetical protein [Persicimonas caeni]QDG53417.1 hypothetical protein FIV42_22530 [Persicimonas caeni]QED34638.1 hypothetical protein FRD00_22525 [Persicimonas caeni]